MERQSSARINDDAPEKPFRHPSAGITSLDHAENVEVYCMGGYHPVDINDVLDGRFKVVHKLGPGGFATIWLARVLNEQRYVALKILMAAASTREIEFFTYLRESGTGHPTIASPQEFFTILGPNGSHQCLVLDVVGPSLDQVTLYHELSPSTIRNAGRQMVEGVAYLHSLGVCHGDLTNSNILFELKNINSWSEEEVYKILGQPQTDLVYQRPTGIPKEYFAPEMLFTQPPSEASDVWALGCLLYELRASRQLLIVFFGTLTHAISDLVRIIGPLPEAWRGYDIDEDWNDRLRPGQHDLWFESSEVLDPFKSLFDEVEPQLTPTELTHLLAVLKGALVYEPTRRMTAKQLLELEWFADEAT